MHPLQLLENRILELKNKSQYRKFASRKGLDFSSNDYLGFAEDADLRSRIQKRLSSSDILIGASGSRLLRGELEILELVEKELALFTAQETAVLFPSGYQANISLLSALLQEGDIVFSDEFNHASLIDGIRLSHAEKEIYPHLDLNTLQAKLELHKHSQGLKVIVTESLFSMEGDLAPLKDLVSLSRTYGALLIVDEAHATGLWGDFKNGFGGGLVQDRGFTQDIFATIHTGGKALGASGAWVSGSFLLKEYLINFSRGLIFSTAPSPIQAVVLGECIHYWKEVGPKRVSELRSRCERFRNKLGLKVNGPIFPILIGESSKALESSEKLMELGFDIRAIRPPTVPQGKSRLRVTLNGNVSNAEMELCISVLQNEILS